MELPLVLQWFSRDGDPTPLNSKFPGQCWDWILHKVKETQQFVGLNCDGFEEQFMTLFTAVEVAHAQGNKLSKKNRAKETIVVSKL